MEKKAANAHRASKMSEIEKGYEAILFALDNEDLSSAIVLTYMLLQSLSHIIANADENQLKSPDSPLHDDDIKQLLKDKETLEAQAKTYFKGEEMNLTGALTLGEFMPLLKRAGKYVRQVHKLVCKKRISMRQILSYLSQHPGALTVISSCIAITILLTAFFLAAGNKFGLTGEYFADRNLSKLASIRTDKTINFNWGSSAPMKNFPEDLFSIRWTGRIKIKTDGNYTFITEADDGVRLRIGNRLLISDWAIAPSRRNAKTVSMRKGTYPIRIEYFENRKRANISLFWRQPGQKETVIGHRYLLTK